MRAYLCQNNSKKYILTEKLPHSFYLLEFEQNVRNNINYYILNIQTGDKTKGDSSL